MSDLAAQNCGLIIFLRFSELGKVKTRIAEELGDEEALKIYNHLTDITLQMAVNLSIPVYLFYNGGLPGENERHPSFHYFPQAKGALGDKITDALKHVFQLHQSVIIIGSDCPGLSAQDIDQAIRLLEEYDVVIGPASDGGYYLLGCREYIPELFTSIDWSTPAVLLQTIAKLKDQGNSYISLRTLEDIDTAAAWYRYQTNT